jgi:hypothetical protein
MQQLLIDIIAAAEADCEEQPPLAPLEVQWTPALNLAGWWERAGTELRIMGDTERSDRYRQHAEDIYLMLGDRIGEDWEPVTEGPPAW